MKSLFLIWIISCVGLIAQDSVYCQRILLTYNESMDVDILDKSNYTVFDDSLKSIEIIEIEIVDTNAVFIYVPILEYRTDYAIRVYNVHDLAGNSINVSKNTAWVFFDGFDINEPQPVLIVK